VHFLRNALARVPKGSAEMVAAAIRTIFAQPTGAEVIDQVDKVAAMLAPKFPAVATMLTDAREDLTAFASFPTPRWVKIWSTNPLERLNKEVKRRTNVVGIFLRDCFPPSAAAWLRQARWAVEGDPESSCRAPALTLLGPVPSAAHGRSGSVT
jgi:putative transposase